MKLISLVAALLNGVAGLPGTRLTELKKRGLLWVFPVAAAGILLLMGTIVFYLLNLYQDLLLIGIETGRPELVFFYAMLGSWIILFLTGIPLSLSLFYYSTDTGLLLSLPLSPLLIVASRLVLLFIPAIPVNILIVAPAVGVYTAGVSMSWELVVSGFVFLIIGPVFPLSLAMLFTAGLSRVVNLGRYRTALEVGGMFFALIMMLGLQIIISRISTDAQSMSTPAGLALFFDRIMTVFLPIRLAALSFFPAKGFLFLFMSIGLDGFLFGIMLMTMRLTFIKNFSERMVSAGKKAGKRKPEVKKNRGRSVVIGILNREWHVLFSNSTFIFQTFGELVIFPVLLVIGYWAIPQDMRRLVIEGISSFPFSDLIVFGVCVLLTGLNGLSATSISREGHTFALNLFIPVEGRKQITAKLLLHLSLYIPVFIIDALFLSLLLGVPLWFLLYMIPGGIVFIVLAFSAHIFIDLLRPLLAWTHPMQAVKNNVNVLIGMGVSFAYCGFFGSAGYVCVVLFGIPAVFFAAGLVLFVTVLDIIILRLLFIYADKQYGGGFEMA
ncbi:MAG: hypothetical protein JW881_19960 [Spirochaetales bacterium]|nr:hypothetical protein [Spirochaetales bacterium]